MHSIHSHNFQPEEEHLGSLLFGAPFSPSALMEELKSELSWELPKYLAPETKFITPENSSASGKSAFILQNGTRKIGLLFVPSTENLSQNYRFLDGVVSLASHQIDALVLLRYIDMYLHLEDSLWLVSQHFPSFFSERGKINLERLISQEARTQTFIPRQVSLSLYYDLSRQVDDNSEYGLWEKYAHNGILTLQQMVFLAQVPEQWQSYLSSYLGSKNKAA